MQRIDVDGVPVFTAPGPGRTTAGLVFGVGLRDETFATREVTHLVEHLVMGSLPKSHLKSNAMTDVDSTVFHATGRPDAVRAFLEGVCRALSDLSLDRMPLEVGVLQAESCSPGGRTVAAMLAARYGLADVGLTVTDGPGPDCLTEDAVRAHAARWFVRENAALWCSGELPAGLTLPLPGGPRPVRARPALRPQDGPVWTKGEMPGVGLLLASDGPWDPALRVAVDVLRERLTDVARRARGLTYHVDLTTVDVTADRREVALVLDAREGQESAVAGILWDQYSDLCHEGPTAEELAHAVAGFEEQIDGEAEAVAEADLTDAAYRYVSGLPFVSVAQGLEAWRGVTAEAATRSLRASRAGALLYVPEEAPYAGPAGGGGRRHMCNVLPELPAGSVFRTPALARMLSRATRLTLVVADGQLVHRDADGDVHGVAWDVVEAVVPIDDERGVAVVGRNNCVVVVHPDLYGRRAVEKVLQSVRAHVPEQRWLRRRPVPDAAETRALEPTR